MCAKALITLIETRWSGWVPGGHSSSKSAQVWAEEKTALSPEVFGHMKSEHPDIAGSFYEIVVLSSRTATSWSTIATARLT